MKLPGSRRRRFQSRRSRLALALTGGILTLLCLGGVGAFTLLYDEATAIQRTAPDAVVDSFLAAFLVQRNDKEAALYQCSSGGNFAAITRFREDTLSREKEYSVKISITWSSLQVTTSGKTGTVGTDLIQTIAGQGRKSSAWQITIVDQDGWRVCGATQS